jgi:hypothetical protein
MAREWDASGDAVEFGSAAAIDDVATRTALLWMHNTDAAAGIEDTLISKGAAVGVGGSGWELSRFTTAGVNTNGALRYYQNRATIDGQWDTANNSLGGAGVPGVTPLLEHVAFTYTQGDAADDPEIYINATLQAEAEVLVPTGAASADAAETLRIGNDSGLASGFTGYLGFFVYDNVGFTSADVNRHRWWGCAPGGPSTVDVWHPMWTDSLVNKGTLGAAVDGTDVGTTMNNTNLPRVERCWAGSMGVGR